MSISNEQHDALVSLLKTRHEADVARLSTRIELDKENIADLNERLEAAEEDRNEFQKVITSIGNAAKGYDFSGGLSDYVAAMQERMASAERSIDNKLLELDRKEGVIALLQAKLAEAEQDATKWHEYQAMKKVLADRGFGKSPMRDMKESK